MNWMEWYDALHKPSWTPSPAAIGLIWTCLYPILLGTYGWAAWRIWRGDFPGWLGVPLAINLAANVAFMPLFSGWRNLAAASIDIGLVWLTIVWGMIVWWPYARIWVAAQLPYLIWVSIASVLQFSIWWSNGRTAA